MGRLPAEVKQTGVTVIKSASNFVFGAAVYAEDGRYDTAFMSNYLDVYVRDSLKRVQGRGRRASSSASAATRCGCGSTPCAWPRRGPDRLRRGGARCASRTCRWRRARSGSSPRPPGQTFQISVRAVGRLSEPRGVRGHHRQGHAADTTVRLKDVGRVELGAEDYASLLQFNGHDAVGVGHHPALQRQRAGGASAPPWPSWSGWPSASRRA